MSDTVRYKPSGAELGLAFLVALGCVFWFAFVALKLWAWFAVPLGAPMLGFAHMLGVILTARYCFGNHKHVPAPPLNETDWMVKHYAAPPLVPAFALGLGALYRAFL